MSRVLAWVALSVLCCFEAYCQTNQWEAKYPLPSIIGDQSQAKTIALEGKDVTLPCRATCDCPQKKDIKTSWLEDGHRVSIRGGVVLPSGDLRITNVSASAVGGKVFRCVASFGNWSVVGIERRLLAIKASKISLALQPSKQTLAIGDIASLHCAMAGYRNDSQEVFWYKGGIPLPTGSSHSKKYQLMPGGYMLIHAMSNADAGMYSCRGYCNVMQRFIRSRPVSVSIGSNNAHIKMPHFTHKFADRVVEESHAVSIHCTASATPLPWVTIVYEQYDAMSKEVASGRGYANFTVQHAKTEHAGKYICKASSGDLVITHSALLKVLARPKFIIVPEKRKLTLSVVALSLTCDATGNPIPQITWYKDGSLLFQSSNMKIDSAGKLTIEAVKPKDVGIYQCFASNKVASVGHSTFVFLESSVRPPINIGAQALSSSKIRVTWQANPLNNANAILAHIIVFKDTRSTANDAVKEKVLGKTSVSEFVIDQLFGGTEYSVYLTTYGKNSVRSQKSQLISAKTLESVPGLAPQPKAVNFGNRTIRVTWSPIPRKHANGKIIRYRIEYGIAGFQKRTIYVPAGKTHVDIHNLVIGELYMIEASAATKVGFGVSEKTTIKIGDPEIAGQKGPPLELLLGEPSQIIAKWSLDKASLITGFEFSYIPVPCADYWHDIKKIQLGPSARSYTIKGVDGSKMHRVELRIQSGPVISKPSIAVYTADKRVAIPSDLQLLKVSNPRDLQCAAKDNTTIFLSWARPVHYADIFDYTVHVVLGGRSMEKFKIPHTVDQKYLVMNVTRGTWYYAKVKANPKQYRITEVRRQLKRAFVVPEYFSKVVACKTAEDRPGPPSRALCNVSSNGHHATITWYPPDQPRGLITKYVVRYREKSQRLTSKWTVGEYVLKPSSAGFPFRYMLNGDYYKKYEVLVSAVNSAGEGGAARINVCALRRSKKEPLDTRMPQEKVGSDQLMSHDTKLGIIVGCTVASLFILTFVVVFIWKNPFRVKSNQAERSQSNAIPNGVCPEDFLYLQRLAELQNSLCDATEYSSRCTSESSSRLNGRSTVERDKDNRPSAEPLMSKYPTSLELTGSSSGQTVCTCTCLLHSRLRGQSTIKHNKPEYLSTSTSTHDDQDGGHSSTRSSTSRSITSEDVDSAESADSRTKMLPKSDGLTCVIKDQVTSTKVMIQKKKETTFQV